MIHFCRILVVVLGLLLTSAAIAQVNPNFAPEQSYAGTEAEFLGPDGWILRDLEERRAVLSTVDFAAAGQRVFWFETLSGGFGDNKLEQCLEVTDPADFAVTVPAWTATPDPDLRIRINVEFYAGLDDCLDRDNRIDDEEDDFRLDDAAETWTSLTLAAPAPAGASHARFSLRARDRTGAGNNPADVPKFIYFDQLEVNGGSLVNGDFEDGVLTVASFGPDQGPFGWTLRSVSDTGLVVAEASAELGSAFRFSELDEGFGDNTLEQCVSIDALDPFVYDVAVWPNVADGGLRVRLAVDLYGSLTDCIDRENRLGDPDFDFQTDDMVAGSWNALRSGLIEAPAAASWARIALRARDRRSDGPDPIVLFDRVALTDRFLVGGSLSGLAAGAELTLDNNGEDLVVDANGAFTFATGLPHNASYAVTVVSQPTSPSQVCTVSAGSGQIDADDVTDVLVECTTNTFTIGGQVEGLAAGNSVVVQLNDGPALTLDDNAPFVFPEALEDGSPYTVPVLENPTSPDQSCTVANGAGVLDGSDVDNILISCATDTYTIGGSLSGLAGGNSVVLQNNAGDDLSLASNGSFEFSQAVADGAPFLVTVVTQPSGPDQFCQIENGEGVVSGTDVDDIEVVCQIVEYTVGGTLSGLASGATVVIQNNAGDDLSLAANGSFLFETPLPDGSSYNVTVMSNPTSPQQSCSVSGGQGTVSGGPVSSVQISCVNDAFFLGGQLSGLLADSTVVLDSGAGEQLSLSGNGAFVFSQPIANGTAYSVSVSSQPAQTELSCEVANATGTIDGSDITNVVVSCTTSTDGSTPPGSGTAAILNPGFGLERAFAGTGELFDGPSGWQMRDLEQRRGLLSTFDQARLGNQVFRFETLERGFGDNKLDQCLPLTAPNEFAVRVHAWAVQAHPALEIRVNAESYASQADCLDRDNRFDNQDFDFSLGTASQRWQAFDLAPTLDADATWVRLSLRARDRSNGGDAAQPPLVLLFDDIQVQGADLINGDFLADPLSGALFGENQGPLGWTLRSVGEEGLIVPEPSAQGGSAFQFTGLGEGFGDNTLEQCVPLELDLFSLGASVWPDRSSSDLRVRLNVDLHASLDDCLSRDNRLARFDTDFRSSDLNQAAWNRITSGVISRPAAASHARIALRARDRIDPPPASPSVILFDQVSLDRQAIGVPVNHPVALALLLLLTLIFAARRLTAFANKES